MNCDEVQGPVSVAQQLSEDAVLCRDQGHNDARLRRVPRPRIARPRVILLCGAPGSGKTTQGKLLAERKKNTVHLSTGDYFRSQIAAGTQLGMEVAKYIDADMFVPDSLVLRVVLDFIRANPEQVVVLDGVPRTVGQAALLNDSCNVLRVVYLHLSKQECADRITQRAAENKEFRDDGDETQTQKRLNHFFATRGCILDHFRNKVAVCDAHGAIEDVYANVKIALDQIVTTEPCFCACKKNIANQLALPCGHCNMCWECAQKTTACPTCNTEIESYILMGKSRSETKENDSKFYVTSSLVAPPKHNRAQVCYTVHTENTSGTDRLVQHIVAVVDVSGSMGSTNAQQEDDDGNLVDLSYTLLDAVKYSLKTLIKCMIHNDRFSLIVFSSNARTLMECELMTDANVERAIALVDAMQSGGGTNLWDGLHRGLEIVQRCGLNQRNTIALLTDGVPDKGCDGVTNFRKYQSNKQLAPFELVTFGYGSQLKANVLFELAELGHGNYIWIPSSSETGSIFVKFMANACTISMQEVTLTIKTANGSNIVADPKGFTQDAIVKRNINECVVKLGSLRFGQTQEVVLDMRIARPSDMYASATLCVGDVVLATLQADNIATSSDAVTAEARLIMCHQLQRALSDSADATYYISEAIEYLECIAHTNPIAAFYLKDLKGEQILLDNGVTIVEGGKISKGASQSKFNRWGCHLIPSYLTTHKRKLCTNLYEVGCMPYDTPFNIAFTMMGKRFYQDFAPTIAQPPKPLVSYHFNSSVQTQPVVSGYSSSSGCGSCIAGDCVTTVRTVTGLLQTRRIDQLRVGDWVVGEKDTFNQIKYVFKKNAPTPLYDFQCGLRLSERHPFRDANQAVWRRAEFEFAQTTSVENIVFNFVLWTEHVMLVNGIACLCLGHDFKDPSVSHPLYGSSIAMTHACKTLIADADNTFSISALERDAQGRVCGFLQF